MKSKVISNSTSTKHYAYNGMTGTIYSEGESLEEIRTDVIKLHNAEQLGLTIEEFNEINNRGGCKHEEAENVEILGTDETITVCNRCGKEL